MVEAAFYGQGKGWRARLAELYRYRYLLRNLVIRDLKVRYKNSL
jgi:hypothetical protein